MNGTQPAICPVCGAVKKALYSGATPHCNEGHGEMVRVSYKRSHFLGKMTPKDRKAWLSAGMLMEQIKKSGGKYRFEPRREKWTHIN